MATKQDIVKTIFVYIHRIIALIVHGILSLIYRNRQNLPPIRDPILLESATSLAYKIRTKELKSVQVLQAFIARIKEINPILNCVVDERFEDALKEAAEIDKKIETGVLSEKTMETETPFLGVPITTKDSIEIKGMKYDAGLYCRRDARGEEDADTIALLKKAGAIPIALTNVPELCMWWESNNKIFGKTNNPYNTTRMVGGSSGGEGCLLASAGSPFGVGSDIGGSIRMPAFFNGIFGHKPSRHTVSNKGQFPREHTEEEEAFLGIGPMCKYSKDLSPMLKIMAGSNGNKLNLDKPVDLGKLKIYYQEDNGGEDFVTPVDPEIKASIQNFVKHMEAKHGVKSEKVAIKNLKQSTDIWFNNLKGRKTPPMVTQLTDYKGEINIYAELVKTLFCRSKITFISLLTALADRNSLEIGSPEHQKLVEQKRELDQEFTDMLKENSVFIFPTHPTPALLHGESVILPKNFSYTAIINALGLPATACPTGLSSQGLPIGFQVIAGLKQDRLCLAVAEEVEKAFGGWRKPPSDSE